MTLAQQHISEEKVSLQNIWQLEMPWFQMVLLNSGLYNPFEDLCVLLYWKSLEARIHLGGNRRFQTPSCGCVKLILGISLKILPSLKSKGYLNIEI